MEAVLTLTGMGTLLWGLVGFIRPSWARLSSRWQAGVIWLFSAVIITASGEFYPTKEAHQEAGATVGAFIGAVVIGGFVFFLRVAFRASALSKGTVGREGGGHVEQFAKKWAGATPHYQIMAQGLASPDQHSLAEAEERRNAGEAFIKKLGERPKRQPDKPQAQRTIIACVDYYSDSDDGENGRVLRRGAPDKTLSFEYANFQGEITIRTLHKWVEYPQYLQGWCEDAGDNRTFRKDRVLEWFQGREDLRAPKGRSRL